MDHREEFAKAFFEFLETMELIPLWEEQKLTQSQQYYELCHLTIYNKHSDATPCKLLTSLKNWLKFLSNLNLIFELKINRKIVERLITQNVCQFKEFPFTEEILSNWANSIFDELWQHYQLTVEALIPLHHLVVNEKVEIQLANSLLCPNDSASVMVQKIDHPNVKTDFSAIRDKCFLRVKVAGDAESRLREVEKQVEKALAVLRFVTRWKSEIKDMKPHKYNPASRVSLREQGTRYLLYYKPEQVDSHLAHYIEPQSLFVLTKNEIDFAYEYYRLEDLNFHFGNQQNPISRRVIRALDLYDSGVSAIGNWQAFYRYVVCINVVLPKSASRGDEIVEMLATLIQYSGYYVGSMKGQDDDTPPETLAWEEMVKSTTKPFQNFYMLRGKILHGNLPIEEISDEDTEEVRTIAHNAVRAMAFLSRQFNWQNDRQAQQWFKAPGYPPNLSIGTEE